MPNIKAKKSLGQHFLNSKEILGEIVSAGNVSEKDTVLEVGPGTGSLTAKLLEKAEKVIAVEKDERLMEILQKKFQKEMVSGKLLLINEDILKFDPSTYNLTPSAYKIIANIPYYITGVFLRKFLSQDNFPKTMVLLIQKEVAERIIAPKGKESLLSLSVKAFGEPKIVRLVGKDHFKPAPKVDSAILSIENISDEFFKDINQENFFSTLKKGFGQKRKKLINNLGIFYEKESLRNIFKNCEIEENSRAEDLGLNKWKILIYKLYQSTNDY